MHYDLSDLDWIDLGETGWKKASVTLDKGDSARDPSSTHRKIYGPAIVTYQQAPDGGIDALVEDLV